MPPDDPAAADAVVAMAYDAAVATLHHQDSTLGNLRNRATGLLSAVTVATTFAGGVGLFSSDAAATNGIPAWTQWTLLPLLLVIGGLCLAVLWPIKRTIYGPSAARILEYYDVDPRPDLVTVQRWVIDKMAAGITSNATSINRRFRYYQFAVQVLVLETGVLVAGLIQGRS